MRNKIFQSDGRAFVLAVDHPLTMPSPEFEDIEGVLGAAVEGGVDAVLASYGCLRHFQDTLSEVGRILRADCGTTTLSRPAEPLKLLYGPADAARVGAHALICMGFPGSMLNAGTLENVAKVATGAHAAGLLAGAEMLPYGFEKPEKVDTRNIGDMAFACRLGAEMGADFIKTEFVGGPRFREVVEACFAPVLVLGGGRTKSEAEILTEVREAMKAGASGVIMGRNIARSGDVAGLCRKISDIIHG